MLKSKKFVKKTKRGAVLTVTAEHYLRRDIWCSHERCAVCKVRAALAPTCRSIGFLSEAKATSFQHDVHRRNPLHPRVRLGGHSLATAGPQLRPHVSQLQDP